MNRYLRSNTLYVFLLVLLQSLSLHVLAGEETFYEGIRGTGIHQGAEFKVVDQYYDDIKSGNLQDDFCIASSKVKVKLRYDQHEHRLTDDFTLKINYDLEAYYEQGNNATYQGQELSIHFRASKATKHKDIDVDFFNGNNSGHIIGANVKITSITYEDIDGNPIITGLGDDVFLDLILDVDRVYDIDQTEVPSIYHRILPTTDSEGNPNTLELNWDYVHGAESYDVEWLFVNTGDYTASNFNPGGIAIDFRKAARINIKENTFQLSLAYPKGYLVYRVRARGLDKTKACDSGIKKELTGSWSVVYPDLAGFITANDAYYQLVGFETNKNWTYSVAYAEGGKYVESAEFFDGTSRNRQSVSSIRAEGLKVVGESVYDYEGRPAVSIAAVPVQDQGMRLYESEDGNSNVIPFNGGYDRTQFGQDGALKLNPSNQVFTQPLGSTSKANQYYSADNPLTNNLYRDYTPNANGFAFTQTHFENDGTGRVKAQSGLGEAFQLKSDQATRIYYENPTQKELNRLFGSEVGYAKHYKKVLTKDANGQVTVAYLDMAGRTIASAYAGNTPANLIPLDVREPAELITSNVLKNGSEKNGTGNYFKTFSKSIENGALVTLDYNLAPLSYSDNCYFDAATNSIDIKYDYYVKVYDNDNDLVWSANNTSGGAPFSTGYIEDIHGASNVAWSPGSASLSPGLYSFEKSLVLNEDAFQAYQDQLEQKLENDLEAWKQHYQYTYIDWTVDNVPATPSSFNPCIQVPDLDIESCNIDCETNCEELYKEEGVNGATIYYDIDYNEVDYTTQAGSTAYHNAVNECKASCSSTVDELGTPCEQYLDMMERQMSPGGMYFDNLPKKYLIDAVTGTTNDVSKQRTEDPSYASNTINAWLQSNLSIATVNTAINTSLSLSVSYSDWDELRTNWEDDYASVLVKYHPEYCKWRFECEGQLDFSNPDLGNATVLRSTINNYNIAMNDIHDDATALNKTIDNVAYNLFNPLGMANNTSNSNLYINYPGATTTQRDPIFDLNYGFQDVSTFVLYQTKIQEALQNFFPTNYNAVSNNPSLQVSYMSIWYLMDDPDNLVQIPLGGTLPAGIDGHAHEMIHTYHNPTTGLFTHYGMSKIQFFRSVYTFYRDLYLHTYFEDQGMCSNYSYWDDDKLRGDGQIDLSTVETPTNEDDYQLVFPYPVMYANVDWSQSPIIDYQVFQTQGVGSAPILIEHQACQSCVSGAEDWMIELNDAGCLDQLNSNAITALRTALIEFCKKAGQAYYTASLSATTNQAQYGYWAANGRSTVVDLTVVFSIEDIRNNPATTFQADEFDDILSYFQLSSCSLTPYPQVDQILADNEQTCIKSKMEAVLGSSPLTAANLSAYVSANFSDYIASCGCSGNLTTLAQKWIDYANYLESGSLENLPHEFECYDCKANNLKLYIEELGFDPTNLTTQDQTDLVAAINSDFNIDLSTTSLGLLGLLNELGIGNNPVVIPTPSVLYGTFPTELRCIEKNQLKSDVEFLRECQEINFYTAWANAEVVYREQMQAYMDEFKQAYKAKAFSDLKTRETWEYTYELNEYYYTLYYYDQAGNLIKTVPPQGVKLVDLSSHNDDINDNRLNVSNGAFVHPNHTFVTNYDYNSFNQLDWQETPDGGESHFWYDDIDRLVVSQNAEQANVSSGSLPSFSYSKYDNLNRIVEAGQINSSVVESMDESIVRNPATLNSWLSDASRIKEQVSLTYYDEVVTTTPTVAQRYLRNRVASSYYFEDYPATASITNGDYLSASHYSYDIHGNVSDLYQENRLLFDAANPSVYLKKMHYDYDLLSGNVNEVAYQAGKSDAFYHRYFYDDNNRLTSFQTSSDHEVWETEAKYFYYPHGPLARVEIGDKKVQAQDYAYTLQGWLKTANATTLSKEREIGKDGNLDANTYNVNGLLAPDVMAYSLHYFDWAKAPGATSYSALLRDYAPIGAGVSFETKYTQAELVNLAAHQYSSPTTDLTSMHTQKRYASLYNGNIARMVTALNDENHDLIPVHNNVYRYDQANRIKGMQVYTSFNSTTGVDNITANNSFLGAGVTGDYETQYEFDKNGNLMRLKRNAYAGTSLSNTLNREMDMFSYNYGTSNNKLLSVDDNVALSANWTVDVDDQNSTNYAYDEIGNLIKDEAEEIVNIEWTVNGKVKYIERAANSTKPDLEFFYDVMGNRIAKLVKPRTGSGIADQYQWEYTYYTRDASGNVMANYKKSYEATGCNIVLDVVADLGLDPRHDFNDFVSVDNQQLLNTLTNNGAAADIAATINGSNVAYTATANGNLLTVVYTGTDNCTSKSIRFTIGASITDYNFSPSQAQELLKLTSRDIYGSDRIGIDQEEKTLKVSDFTADVDVNSGVFTNYTVSQTTVPTYTSDERWLGYKNYELKNHLGNVLSVVSDRKILRPLDLAPVVGYQGPGAPGLQVQQRNAISTWQPFGSAQVLAEVNNDLELEFQDAGDRLEKRFSTELGKLYTIELDVISNNVDDLYLGVIEKDNGLSYQEVALTGAGHYSIDLAATTGELSVALIQKGTGNGALQTVSIENLEIHETTGDQLSEEILLGIGDWKGNGRMLISVENERLRATGLKNDYIYRVIDTEPGKAYLVKTNIFFPSTNGGINYKVRIEALNTSSTQVYKHDYLLAGEEEFAFVALEDQTTLRLKAWTSETGVSNAYAEFQLNDFAVYELEDSSAPVALSNTISDWTLTGGASLANDAVDNHLILTLNERDDKASIGLPVGYQRVDIDYSMSSSSNSIYLIGDHTYDYLFGDESSGKKSFVDKIPVGEMLYMSQYYDITTPLTIDLNELKRIPQSIGKQLLYEDYQLPTIKPVNGGSFTIAASTANTVNQAPVNWIENWDFNSLNLSVEDGKLKAYGLLGGTIVRTIPTIPGKAYVVKLNSIYDLGGLPNTLTGIRIRALNGSNDGNFKHTQLGSGEKEFYFVANEATTKISLQTWSNVSHPEGSPAGFMLEEFEVFEVDDAGSPVAISLDKADWSTSGGATIENDPVDGRLIVNVFAPNDRAKVPVSEGILRIEMDHEFSGGQVSDRVILDCYYSFDVAYRTASPGVKSAIDKFPSGSTFDILSTLTRDMSVEIKDLKYIPQVRSHPNS